MMLSPSMFIQVGRRGGAFGCLLGAFVRAAAFAHAIRSGVFFYPGRRAGMRAGPGPFNRGNHRRGKGVPRPG